MTKQRILWTVLALVATGAAFSGFVDATGETYAEKAFKRALVTFAVARTLNGVISVAQGTEIAVEPGGVGVNFSVGQVLDPVNDLVERFSAVMLIAASSLGMQNILLKITSWWWLTLALACVAGVVIATLWWPGAAERYSKPAMRVLLVMVFVRFAVPILIIGSNLVFDTFLHAEQAAATAALESTQAEIEILNEESAPAQEKDQSLMERLGSMIDESIESMNVADRLERLKETASNASEHIINLIVIFVLQTIVLPLVFVWLFVELLKGIATRTTRI